MKQFIVRTATAEIDFNFPTTLEELSDDYLKQVTESIIVAPNYSLIGLVYHERLANLIITCKNKRKNTSIGVNPIFIKSGGGDNSVVDNANLKQRLLIANTQIQLGHHCATPNNKLTLDYFSYVINNSEDKDLYQKALSDKDQTEILFIEFKIVPNCDIIALYNKPNKVDNPYIKVNSMLN